MKMVLVPVVSVLALAPTVAAAPSWDPYRETVTELSERLCQDSVATPDRGACMSSVFQLVDQELNRVYKLVTTHLTQPPPTGPNPELTALRDAQRQWIKHRDAERRLREESFSGGSLAAEEGLVRAIEVTMARIDDLAMIAPYVLARQHTARQLDGRWVDPTDENHWYRFVAKTSDAGDYSCRGPSGSSFGTFRREDGNWSFSEAGCDDRTAESILIGWIEDGGAHRMRFVHDGPSVTAHFVRQKVLRRGAP